MSFTRAQVKYEILQKLNKSAATRGFYTDEKCNSAIQEAIDFIAAQMFIADDGWSHKMDFIDIDDGCVTVPIKPSWAMIVEVRYLLGDTYIPISYDQRFGDNGYSSASGAVQFPSRYQVIDNCFYFNPAISTGGTKALQVEFMAYPKRLSKDTDFLESQFDKSMFWFAVYRSCSIMASSVGEFAKAWTNEESSWWASMQQIIFKRNQQVTPIREFNG